MRVRYVCGVALVSLMGCQRPPDISTLVDDHGTLLNDVVTATCDCFQDFGYESSSECDLGFGSVDSTGRQCLLDVLRGHEEDAEAYLSCANLTLIEFSNCLDENDSCEPGGYDNCVAAYMGAEGTCPQLSGVVQNEFAACVPALTR